MARYMLFVVSLLALGALASAQFWPAGEPGAEKLEDPSGEASIAASPDQRHKHRSARQLLRLQELVGPFRMPTNFSKPAACCGG
jgi:hypothetical protein